MAHQHTHHFRKAPGCCGETEREDTERVETTPPLKPHVSVSSAVHGYVVISLSLVHINHVFSRGGDFGQGCKTLHAKGHPSQEAVHTSEVKYQTELPTSFGHHSEGADHPGLLALQGNGPGCKHVPHLLVDEPSVRVRRRLVRSEGGRCSTVWAPFHLVTRLHPF